MGIFTPPHIRPQTAALEGSALTRLSNAAVVGGWDISGCSRWWWWWWGGRFLSLFFPAGWGGGGGEREGPTCQDMSRTGEAPRPQGPCWYLLAHPNRLRPPPPPVTPPLRLGTSRVPPPPTPPSSAPACISSPLTLYFIFTAPQKCTKVCWENPKKLRHNISCPLFVFVSLFFNVN